MKTIKNMFVFLILAFITLMSCSGLETENSCKRDSKAFSCFHLLTLSNLLASI